MDRADSELPGAIDGVLAQKKDLLRLFLIAAILSFAVGAFASLFAAQTFLPVWSTATVCGCLFAVAMLLLLQDLLRLLVFTDISRAVLFIDPKENSVIPVEDYRFSDALSRTLGAVKAENKAIYSDWEKYPLVSVAVDKKLREKGDDSPQYYSVLKVQRDAIPEAPPKAIRLLEEAAHFVLLEELSLHLSSYFSGSGSDSLVRELSREDIPEFLLKNRVLNLLSTPIEQRDIFLKALPESSGRPKGVIYSVFGTDGSVFSRFDLVLPRGSSVKASDDGGITVETRRFSLTMKAVYAGTVAVTGRSFVEHYIGVRFAAVESRNIVISLSGRVKALSLLTSSGWQYYRWLDSYRKRLRNSCDFDEFRDSIHWRVVETFLHTFRAPRRIARRVQAVGERASDEVTRSDLQTPSPGVSSNTAPKES